MLERLMNFLDNADTERRIAGTIAATLVPIANQHLSTPLSTEAVGFIMAALMGYVFQSAHVAATRAKAAAISTPEQAAAVLAAVK